MFKRFASSAFYKIMQSIAHTEIIHSAAQAPPPTG
jgi:hypothetical protein